MVPSVVSDQESLPMAELLQARFNGGVELAGLCLLLLLLGYQPRRLDESYHGVNPTGRFSLGSRNSV
jgi:hypothetical protein